MKWLLFLLAALIATSLGIMLFGGAFKYACQMAFYGVLVVSFCTLTMDFSWS